MQERRHPKEIGKLTAYPFAPCPFCGIPDRLMTRILIWLLSQALVSGSCRGVFGPYFFWRGFALLRPKRLKMDIPRSTVRAAAWGDVRWW